MLACGSLVLVALRVASPVGVVAVITSSGGLLLAAHRKPVVEAAARSLVTRVAPALVGWAVVIIGVDAAAGTLWDHLTDRRPPVPLDAALADVELPPSSDPRAASEVYGDAAWVDRYFAELAALDYGYVPFVGPRVEAVTGRYITSRDGVRRSYEPEPADDVESVEVWFFGGSTMWGEGQRDEHTIASHVSRLAEDDGVSLRVVNYGERGYTAFQEFLLFEQELAARGAPDLAVFYDGVNEIGTQSETQENLSEHPTVYQLADYLAALERAPALPNTGEYDPPGAWERYRETSAAHKLLRRLGIDPADAQEGIVVTPQAVRNASLVYNRSITLQRDLARRLSVPVVHYWQPARPYPAYAELTDRIPPGVIDLTEVFVKAGAEDRVFLDGAHTNELGARIVAEAMWADLRQRLRRIEAT